MEYILGYFAIIILLFLLAYFIWFAAGETDKRQNIINAAIAMKQSSPRMTARTRNLYEAINDYEALKDRVPAYRRRSSNSTSSKGAKAVQLDLV